MLTRLGFVSNSSSSSFVIIVNNEKNPVCTECKRKTYSVEELVTAYPAWDGPNRLLANGKESVLSYLHEACYREVVDVVEQADEDQMTIYLLAISHHDPGLYAHLLDLQKKGILMCYYLEE